MMFEKWYVGPSWVWVWIEICSPDFQLFQTHLVYTANLYVLEPSGGIVMTRSSFKEYSQRQMAVIVLRQPLACSKNSPIKIWALQKFILLTEWCASLLHFPPSHLWRYDLEACLRLLRQMFVQHKCAHRVWNLFLAFVILVLYCSESLETIHERPDILFYSHEKLWHRTAHLKKQICRVLWVHKSCSCFMDGYWSPVTTNFFRVNSSIVVVGF